MIKKLLKIIIKIILISIIIQTINIPNVNAITLDDIFAAGDNFINEGKTQSKKNSAINSSEFRLTVASIGNILTSLGVVLAVIIGAILGIQIMCGSVEQQAKVKEMLMPYAIGCIVIFGAFGIWKLAVTIFSQLQ